MPDSKIPGGSLTCTNTYSGGKDNFAADREAAEQAIAAYPGVTTGARANRQFLARAVRHLAADAGIRQFLDLGTGIPTANNTHEVAQAAAPASRVVYVDYDIASRVVCTLFGAVRPLEDPSTGTALPRRT